EDDESVIETPPPKPLSIPVVTPYAKLQLAASKRAEAKAKASTETKSSFGTDYGRAKKEFIARLKESNRDLKRAALEQAWKDSGLRESIVSRLSEAERKRRRY
ncbi:unnamed protein product, partial [Durusdinium trenchii]